MVIGYLRLSDVSVTPCSCHFFVGLRLQGLKNWDSNATRKLAYYGHTTRKQGSCLEKEIMQGTMPGACRRRPCTAWMDNIYTWTGLSVEMSEINEESTSMAGMRSPHFFIGLRLRD